MKKKVTKVMAAAAVLTMFMGFSAYAGWEQDENGFKYLYDSNAYARSGILEVEGSMYYFDQNAYMKTGWVNVSGTYYYFDESGVMHTGWLNDNNAWYYLDPSTGAMHTGWLNIGTNRYYLAEADNEDGITVGKMLTGYFRAKGNPNQYFAEDTGVVRRNGLYEDYEGREGYDVKFNEDGTMLYRTNNTATLANSWHTLLYGEWQTLQDEGYKEEQSSRIEEAEEELYETYMKNVYSRRTEKSYASKLEKWKTNVERKLSELGASSTDIQGFISDVQAGRYDDGDYEY
jgi:hypothetical protein